MSSAPSKHPPLFSPPARWLLRVLAWLAFGVSAFLAWHALHGSSIAACGVGDQNACDVVLSSSWSKWMGIPVAVAGLACYASLAALSVLLGLQHLRASRWINTAFVMLSILAAGASAWFIGVQVLAIGRYCMFCLIADTCGLALGATAIWCTARWMHETRHTRRTRSAAAGLMALRTALPTTSRSTAAAGSSAAALPTPSLPIAVGGALAALALLVTGQLVKPSKTYNLQTGALDQPVALVGSNGSQPKPNEEPSDTQRHVTMRIPTAAEGEERERDAPAEQNVNDSNNDSAASATASSNGSAAASPSQSDSPPGNSTSQPKRLVKFLGGKLTLDVYKHPLIGSPEAPQVMIEMLAYDCPHCRMMHRIIEKGLARYGNDVAIIVMPIPLEKGCNKFVTETAASHRGACVTARLAIGVATIRPQQYIKFHNWLMAGKEDKPPMLEKILPKAYELVDRDRLRNFIRDEPVNKQIAQYIDLYARLRDAPGAGRDFGLPVQILGDKVMTGTVQKEEDVFKAWEEHLGVGPSDSQTRTAL
jgi:uncharacterized membrane protein/thiol-disulfide isomerase/thioredoxin